MSARDSLSHPISGYDDICRSRDHHDSPGAARHLDDRIGGVLWGVSRIGSASIFSTGEGEDL